MREAFQVILYTFCLFFIIHGTSSLFPVHRSPLSTAGSVSRINDSMGQLSSKLITIESANGLGKNENQFEKTLRSLLPILLSAFSAAAIMYPLDLVRALKMANAGAQSTTLELLINFKNAHGYKGFFTQGLLPELTRATWMRFIKFGLFPIAHLMIAGVPDVKGTSYTKALAAICASIPEAISIMPLEIAKIALQLDTANVYNNNMIKAMAAVFQDKGLKGFTVGYVGVQLRQSAWSVGYFASIKMFSEAVDKTIDMLSDENFRKTHPEACKITSQILSGFFAGIFGGLINTPFDTIRSTIQKKSLSGLLKVSVSKKSVSDVVVNGILSTSFFEVANEIISTKGYLGLYTGFGFKALHLGGGGALMAFLIPFFTKKFLNNDN